MGYLLLFCAGEHKRSLGFAAGHCAKLKMILKIVDKVGANGFL